MWRDEQVDMHGKRCRKRRSHIRKKSELGKNRVSKSKKGTFQKRVKVKGKLGQILKSLRVNIKGWLFLFFSFLFF